MPELESPEAATSPSRSSEQNGKGRTVSVPQESKKRGHVEPALVEHVIAIEVEGFRKIDDWECQQSAGTSAAVECFKALNNPQGETFTVFADDHPCAMFGCAPISDDGWPPGHGVLWFLASKGLFEIKSDFMIQVSNWMDYLQRYTPVCHNFVSVENTIALKWVVSVGFEVHEPAPYGKKGELFCQVVRRMENVNSEDREKAANT